jgi:hypothetical protein
VASPTGIGEPPACDRPGALDADVVADVVAALRHLAKAINHRLQLGTSGGQQGFAVER